MLRVLLVRLGQGVLTLFALSIVSFVIMALPPGDAVSNYISRLSVGGVVITDEAVIQHLREQFHLDDSLMAQYWSWIGNIVRHGDFGFSFSFGKPVTGVIGNALVLSFLVSASAMVFTVILGLAVGIYSAVRQNSFGDHLATFIGFFGLAVPEFLSALVLMFAGLVWFHISVGGLFSSEYLTAPWSSGKFWDLAKHLIVPALVLGTGGAASVIRVMRANLLDELHKPYVMTARAKGLREYKVILKYPFRVALNPFVSSVGFIFPQLVSGAAIVAVVLTLPTLGPMLFKALLNQDQFLAGGIVLLLGALTVVGTLVSDILLIWLDPRIRHGVV